MRYNRYLFSWFFLNVYADMFLTYSYEIIYAGRPPCTTLYHYAQTLILPFK